MSAQSAARKGGSINQEVSQQGRTHFRWDQKRKLLDRDANVFSTTVETAPYLTVQKLHSAEQQALVRRGLARKKRRERAPEVLDQVLRLLDEGVGVREIQRRTGVPQSTCLRFPHPPRTSNATPRRLESKTVH